MGLRTVRLDGETEKALKEVTRRTGWSVSATLKRGFLALREQVTERVQQSPAEVYRKLDLGPGGYAIAPSVQTRQGVQAVLRRKSSR